MQQIRIDFDNPGLPQSLGAVEGESQSRIFQAALYKSGAAYTAPAGAVYSIMYRGFGPQNQGWYDTIEDGAGKRAACTVSGNIVTCELARQALRVPGHLTVVLCLTDAKGYMLKSWPIMADVRNDGYEDTVEVESFFYITQITSAEWTKAFAAWEDFKATIDPTLTLSGKAADAKATGAAVNKLEGKKADKTDLDTERKRIDVLNEGGLNLKDEVIDTSIKEWLADHPEATTTVQDGSLTFKKFKNGEIPFVTPEMFGAVGDGITDDTESILNAINNGKVLKGDSNKVYAISQEIVIDKPYSFEDLTLKVISSIDTCIRYSHRRVRLVNIDCDCNNLSNYGIKGDDTAPIETRYVADIEHCSVINALHSGYATGQVRTSYKYCIAKNCDIGFNFETTDTTSDSLIPIDCRIGIKLASSTTIISCHPWAWIKKQIAFYVPKNVDNVVIGTFFNDTNNVGFECEDNVKIIVNNLVLFNNTDAPYAIDETSARLFNFIGANDYGLIFKIDNVIGSFSPVDDYLIYPNVDLSDFAVTNVSIHDMPQFVNAISNTCFREVYYPLFKEMLSIDSSIHGIESVTMNINKLESNINTYKCHAMFAFNHTGKLIIPSNTDILTVKLNRNCSAIVNSETSTYNEFDFKAGRLENGFKLISKNSLDVDAGGFFAIYCVFEMSLLLN